jgi:hypothetical protein
MTKIISISNQAALYCIDVLKIKQGSEFYRNIAAKFTSQTANFLYYRFKLNEEAKLIKRCTFRCNNNKIIIFGIRRKTKGS